MPRKQAAVRRQSTGGKLPAQPNQSLIDGLRLLQALAVAKEPAGVRELARALEWNPMRVNRLLKTLAGVGLARQEGDRRYTAGPGMHILSVQSLYASGLLPRAVEAVKLLPADRHGVALGVLWQDQVCYLFHARPRQSPAAAVGAHELYPATRSSIGMMLLSALGDPELRRLYAHRPTAPFAGIDDLLRQLDHIRALGHAYIEQRTGPQRVASVAVTIGSPPFAALALTDGITETSARRHLPALRSAADLIAGL